MLGTRSLFMAHYKLNKCMMHGYLQHTIWPSNLHLWSRYLKLRCGHCNYIPPSLVHVTLWWGKNKKTKLTTCVSPCTRCCGPIYFNLLEKRRKTTERKWLAPVENIIFGFINITIIQCYWLTKKDIELSIRAVQIVLIYKEKEELCITPLNLHKM